jgi:hypothetical protein
MWSVTTTDTGASGPIIHGLALRTPARVVEQLAATLTRYRRRIRSPWRAHDVMLQAVLTFAFLEGGHTYRGLAAGNGIPRATCHTYIQEGIKVLARRALPLTEVVRLAAKAGWPYLIVDGVNIPTERIKARYTAKQYWYSGKHHRHGAAVQTVAAPDGELLWVSGVLPGRTMDITAARRFGIAEKVLAHLGLLADLGYIGLHPEAIVGYRRRRGQKTLPAGRKAANIALAGIRAIGERGNSQLKCWKVLAGDYRGSPTQITMIVKAVQAVQYMIRDPFGTARDHGKGY